MVTAACWGPRRSSKTRYLPGATHRALQIQSEFRARDEEMAKTQGGVTRHCALPVHDLGDGVRWYLDLPGQFSRAYLQFVKLFGETVAGMNSLASQDPCRIARYVFRQA